MEVIAKTLKDYRDLKVARMEVSQCLGFMQLDAKSPSRAWQLLLQHNLFFFNASILSLKRRPYIQRKHSEHHMTDLHMLASPQLLVADVRGHMDTCWPLDAPQLAELCSDQGITCHQSLAESSHLSKHEAGRIWKLSW